VHNPKKLQSPFIVPPESISQNWISKKCFDPTQNITLSFKLKCVNTSDKELGFGIFIVDSPTTDTYGATTARCTDIDYSTKGEVGEVVEKDGDKVEVSWWKEPPLDEGDNPEETLVEQPEDPKFDLLLDHVYQQGELILCKNQNAFDYANLRNRNIITVVFDSTKNIFREFQDIYKNVYFDELVVKDFITDEVVDPQTYHCPIFIQILKNLYVLEFKREDGKQYEIFKWDCEIFRLAIQTYGKSLRFDILDTNDTFYTPIATKIVNLDLRDYENLRVGYSLATPNESYDKDKIADFEIVDFHIQGALV
jgi:hypothetical protein